MEFAIVETEEEMIEVHIPSKQFNTTPYYVDLEGDGRPT